MSLEASSPAAGSRREGSPQPKLGRGAGGSTTACIVCGAPARVLGEGAHRTASCRRCGLDFVTPPLDDASGITLQSECIVHDDTGRGGSFDAIERTMKATLEGTGRVLDVGCGAGAFMLMLRARGWQPVGIDINERAVDAARMRGLDARLTTIDHVEAPAGGFDAAVLMNSLEYFARPLDALERIAHLMRPGGVVVLETPNTSYHRLQAAVGQRLGLSRERLMMVEPRHGRRLIAFGVRSARQAFAQTGFTDIVVRPSVPRASGSAAERLLRRLIFRAAGAVFLATHGRVLLAPSMIAVAKRPPTT